MKSQISYVRQILATQVDWNACETKIGPPDTLPDNPRYSSVQKILNSGGTPSEEIIVLNKKANGSDYRHELSGEHPVQELRKAAGF